MIRSLYGHIDVIKKSLNVFDRVIIATTDNINKNYYFSIEERLVLLTIHYLKTLNFQKQKLKSYLLMNLTIDLCKKYKANYNC